MKAPDVTSTSITVTWDPPQNLNGRAACYEVRYTNGGSTSVATVKNLTTKKLINLKPSTKYDIYVRAKTAVEIGEASFPIKISTSNPGMYIGCSCVHDYKDLEHLIYDSCLSSL